ncbi:MAG TPA: hypothetical protein VM049_04500 [Gaiellaceae bacterium]|nr:hypothetical protein [Gaiellaceae bacterium]
MTTRRWAALAGLTAALGAYTAGAGHLWNGGLWPDVLFLSVVLIPATLGIVWLALPLANQPGLLVAGVAMAALAVLLRLAELDVLFNLGKLLALVLLGFWFLSYFETVAWAVLIAAIIPWVDAVSVWRGPTNYVVDQQPQIFDNVSIAFRIPGEAQSANLGPPDILFFALFVAAAGRFGLRPAWTWLTMTALIGVTLILAVTTDVGGLPALPAVAFGFLLANADLIWHALRRRGRAPVRIYGRTDASFYDLDADVIERGRTSLVVLTRDRPPVLATLEPVRDGEVFPVRSADLPADEVLCRLTIGGAAVGEALVHDLANGVVVVPRDEDSRTLYDVHPEQLAADEAKVERLKRERR